MVYINVDMNHELIDNMELRYGITLHKAQGSQFPRVIVAFSKGRIVDRAWLYTAITRAEYELHIVGSESDFREIVSAKSYASKRKSYLLELIKSEISGE